MISPKSRPARSLEERWPETRAWTDPESDRIGSDWIGSLGLEVSVMRGMGDGEWMADVSDLFREKSPRRIGGSFGWDGLALIWALWGN